MLIALDAIIIFVLMLIAIVDARKMIIPDSLSLTIAGLAIISAYLEGSERMLDAGLGALLAFLVFEGTRRVMTWRLQREAMGFGDVKLMTAGGFWVGAQVLPDAMLVGCLAAFIGYLARYLVKPSDRRDSAIPFGPFLALGLIVAKSTPIIMSLWSHAT